MILLKRLGFIPAVLIAVLALVSCDDDFTTIGGELIGGEFDSLPSYSAGVQAHSKNLGAVQTNGLPVNLLGVYKEPVYGLQTASVLSQLSLSSPKPDFGNEPRLDSVILTLPYFSTRLEPDEDGNPVFRLDSVYGDSPFKLKVSRSNFFLNDFDPESNFEDRQKYYSDQGPVFKASLIGDPLYVDESFQPSASEVVYFENDPSTPGNEIDTVRVSPRLRVPLPTQFFKENIIDKQGSSELSNNNNFRNFIRGLYFEAEPLDGSGSMMLLNLSGNEAGIVLYYTAFQTVEDSITEIPGSYKLDLGGNTVNTYSQELPAQIALEIQEASEETGAENLYLNGGAGSMAVINLFEDEAELEELRANNWLINEASLTFFVDQDKVFGGNSEPERIYLYNLKTNQPLFDYRIDQPNVDFPLISLTNHSGRLVRDEDKNGISYKIRITEHVKQILGEDGENVKLGLVITQNINLLANSALKNPVDGIDRVPSASVITPRGTVLHGNLESDPGKRLKFNIIYTETNN
ncbi:DUF4270 domain-containing protein [Gillisia limnaea]|uniref:DUF4270 domain-containing protein n=1 Tax=Gillisia limnaea (strain DSM 15749 / LMG 21470 / R-8282) TaxID=865937 RepID=H2BSF6_GILLR|nr:DUF4270 domain-containing protein [Gillisia limnaea]EHQ02503.1 hypothetical protein Gilli_1861 [Gillisia limnaea DSM 15749]